MKISLDDLHMFIILVEANSFTLAAKQLLIPKSKLSRHIIQLEQNIGSQLLIRTTRSQQLTESGKLVYQACKNHIDALNQVEEEISALIGEPKGQLNILLPLEFFNLVISELVIDFAKMYPKITLNCSHYTASMPEIDYEHDLAFVLHETQLPASNWIAKSLLSFPQSLYSAKEYDISQLKSPEDLIHENCVLSESQEHWLFRDGNSMQTVPVSGKVIFSSPQMRQQATIRQLGIAKLPDYACHNDCQLKKVQLNKSPVAQQLSVLYQSRSIPLKTRAFLDFFQSHIGRLTNVKS